jgi:hypothetical protein
MLRISHIRRLLKATNKSSQFTFFSGVNTFLANIPKGFGKFYPNGIKDESSNSNQSKEKSSEPDFAEEPERNKNTGNTGGGKKKKPVEDFEFRFAVAGTVTFFSLFALREFNKNGK